jgi:hypothetical protein
MKKNFILIIFISISHATAEEIGNYQVLGRVTESKYIETQRKQVDTVDNVVGSMFGIFGAIFTDITSIEKRAYYTYKISTEDNRMFEVASRANFNKNDCVKVIYPKLPGGIPESGIDTDTKLEANKECIENPSSP